MDYGLILFLCAAYYGIAYLITYVRVEEEAILHKIIYVYRVFEGLLYSATTILFCVATVIWLGF